MAAEDNCEAFAPDRGPGRDAATAVQKAPAITPGGGFLMPEDRYCARMDTLEFSSPGRERRHESVVVTLAGEDITCHRPKDAVLWAGATLVGEEVPSADRAMGLLQFINGVLEAPEQQRFYSRVADRHDPLGRHATFNLMRVLLGHWSPEGGGSGPLVAEQDEPVKFYGDEPINIKNEAVELEFVAYPPKDLAVMMMASGLATGAQIGQQAWAVGFFLDSCTTPADRALLRRRLLARHDPLDMENIAEAALALLEQWAPEVMSSVGNRAERRAATRKTSSGSGTARKTSSSGSRARKTTSGTRTRK